MDDEWKTQSLRGDHANSRNCPTNVETCRNWYGATQIRHQPLALTMIAHSGPLRRQLESSALFPTQPPHGLVRPLLHRQPPSLSSSWDRLPSLLHPPVRYRTTSTGPFTAPDSDPLPHALTMMITPVRRSACPLNHQPITIAPHVCPWQHLVRHHDIHKCDNTLPTNTSNYHSVQISYVSTSNL